MRSAGLSGQRRLADAKCHCRSPRRSPVCADLAEIIEIATGGKLLARTSDASRTGCYVDTLNPAPKGTQIQLRLIRGKETFETQAGVVYVSPGPGMGIRFHEETSAQELAKPDRWLGHAARNP